MTTNPSPWVDPSEVGKSIPAADRLRTAATQLREAAGAATPGPWEFQPWSTSSLPSGDYAESILLANASPDGEITRELSNADGAYIAFMHPPVALALADWLDAAARDEDAMPRGDRYPTAVADAILGSHEPTPRPMPEPTPEMVERLLNAPARPWTPPEGIEGIY